MIPLSKSNCLKHYTWGEQCDGWNFIDDPSLSIKQERMPARTEERLHVHHLAQQFFFILKGVAQFEVNKKQVIVKEGEGLKIEPGQAHRIINHTDADLEFLLCSHPSTLNDRHNVE